MPPLGATAGSFKFLPFFGNAVSSGAGFAIGIATGPTLRPGLQDLENITWSAHRSKPLDAEIAAAIVAEDVDKYAWGDEEAGKTGISSDSFRDLYGEALNAPGIPQLFEAWRRDLITDAAFEHGLRKAKLEPRWDEPLKALKSRLLTLSDLANARQQGYVGEARQKSESALQGLGDERAELLFLLSGLPLGVETMQQALNRELVTRAEFDQAIREGHTKTKYTDLAEALRHPVLSAPEYATLHLKGWIDEGEMNAGGALHGFTPEQMHLLYLARGRPAAPGQMATAAVRGIDGPAGRPVDREQFITAIRQSDIRPEYGPMLWESRFLYLPVFQLNRLVEAGVIDADTARDWATKQRLAPEIVAKLHTYWLRAVAAKGDPHVSKAETQLWGTLHRSYLAGDATEVTVREKLAQLNVPAGAHDAIVNLWNHERELIRQRLTATQVKKAYRKAVTNPATGTAWSRDDALAELLSRGWSSQDANTFLDE